MRILLGFLLQLTLFLLSLSSLASLQAPDEARIDSSPTAEEATTNDEPANNKPILEERGHTERPLFQYLPLAILGGEEAIQKVGEVLGSKAWEVVATRGVQWLADTDELHSTSALFDGENHLELRGSTELNSPNLSVELWFRSDQVWNAKYWPGSSTIISKFTSGWASSDWGIIGGSLNDGVDEGRILVGVGPNGGGDVVLKSPPGLNDGSYHYVVWTRSASGENTLYIDGNPVDQQRDKGGAISNTRPIHLGGEGWEPGGRSLIGAITSVAIYDHVLSEDTVRSHFDLVKIAPRLPPAASHEVQFETDIKPILQKYCFECHGPGNAEGGFTMANRAQVIDGGDQGTAVRVGRSTSSPLVHRITGFDQAHSMPPDRDGLTNDEIGLVRAWIDQGLLWSRDEEMVDPRLERFRAHWSFQPLAQPRLPELSHATHQDWVRTPIDQFIAKGLESAELTPTTEATRNELLRRVCFDLTGLPPSREQIAKFTLDTGADTYESLVDELLGSNAYAERWARHWLDIVRYADSGGFETDILYEQAWRYRDYVTRSFASNKPMDIFLMEQVAGDELWPDNQEMSDAVALWTIGPWPNALDAYPEMLEYVRRTDQVSTFGEAMLGLTLGCANCHNHKYDPITQRDYFGLEAIFAASETWDRNTNKKHWGQGERSHFRIFRHAEVPQTIRLLSRGELSKPRGIVQPMTPNFFSENEKQGDKIGVGRELAENFVRRAHLAQWLVSNSNPLTARCFVNRVWQWHFGKGITSTPNDLGLQGAPPSHPELLDWLSVDFCKNGWDLKRLHRQIVLSATYQQSTIRAPEAIRKDPDNKTLSGFSSRRLSAEEVWDSLHAAAGILDQQCFGEPFVPSLSGEEMQGIYDIEQNPSKKWPVTREQSRRALYLLNRRSFRFPFFEAFDPPNNGVSCPIRQSTTVPAQALTMMNNQLISRLAMAMSEQLIREEGNDYEKQIRLAWLLAYQRQVSPEELGEAQRFIKESERIYRMRGIEQDSLRALADLCLAIFNTSEFIVAN